ncbi:GMP/IMP nucleotidase [Yersinia bercovieri]|uniref:GMP/IMP nucleotidase n=1 Tax=Yersinia bercovieri TaxID=634 RepID=UPI0005E65E33|nr:GMP/IMP nucleotidase [Yersinia bercovieri]MDN0104002.1 GMP/IMP nucleotidase [Yersinia bercovieri]CFQ37587.1 putative hydrolase [Yersinia bercovieri]CNI39065.1 putative hydrolase [Yersinia bercovieri]
MPPELNWQEIDTVLLDMDGTLLDLEFDSHFWLKQVPERLSQHRGIPLASAHKIIHDEYLAVQHTLNWYCFDYWSERLDLDIYAMTTEAGSRVRLRQDTEPFLSSLRERGLQTILLTNAHPHSLAVKIEHTALDQHLDLLLSTHTFGYPKEDQRLWQAVVQHTGLVPARTLFVDDSEAILDAAHTFGIRYCLGIENPDSSCADKIFHRHPAINDYRKLLPALQLRCE